MNIKGKHFYNTADFSVDELNFLIDKAIKMKNGLIPIPQTMKGKSLSTMFFGPSLRTRLSFYAGVNKLGGTAIDLPVDGAGSYSFEFETGVVMNKSTKEHVKEAAQVISKYSEVIAIRSGELITNSDVSVKVKSWDELKEDKIQKEFMKYSKVPIINMESNVYHPCQALGDAMTIKDKLGNPKGKKYVMTWVNHPKSLPMATPNSQIQSACDLGMYVTVAFPKGWDLDPEIMKVAKAKAEQAGGSLSFTNSIDEAFKDANIVCAKSWGALGYYGSWDKEAEAKKGLSNWIVDAEKMKSTNNAYFMHCLPVRRNVEVTDEVIDSPQSIVVDEAENRMWAQMAVLSEII